MTAYISYISVYIGHTEVWHLSFPRFEKYPYTYNTLSSSCKARLDEALGIAKKVLQDNPDSSPEEYKKLFRHLYNLT